MLVTAVSYNVLSYLVLAEHLGLQGRDLVILALWLWINQQSPPAAVGYLNPPLIAPHLSASEECLND
jgi:hypothetical protein